MPEILECKEFAPLSVRISSLLEDGELRLDERITSKGYLTASMQGGQIVLRSSRFVGTIPLTSSIVVRIVPRAPISNLTYMLVRSGEVPASITGFARGYMPRFISADNAESIYGRPLVDGVKAIARKGFAKEYLPPRSPMPWRGKLLASDTARRHAAKGVQYRHEFEQRILTNSTIENIAIKKALQQVLDWFIVKDRRNVIIREASALLRNLWSVADWSGSTTDLVQQLGRKIHRIPPHLAHYSPPLWVAYLILQKELPDLTNEGFVRLDSLIIDISKVFEGFLRRELSDRLSSVGYQVVDGNNHPVEFFKDGSLFKVHPDVIIKRDGDIVALLDAKYKLAPKESDRYEVLSFMDACGVKIGGFLCPNHGSDTSRYLGETASDKKMVLFRYDLAADDLDAESSRLTENVLRMLAGNFQFA